MTTGDIVWHWPQYVVAALIAYRVCLNVAKTFHKHPEWWSLPVVTVIVVVVEGGGAYVLHAGGFW